jgi:hypothetical protein
MKHKVKMTKWSGPILKVYEVIFESLEEAREHAHKHKHHYHNVKVFDENQNMVMALGNVSAATYA